MGYQSMIKEADPDIKIARAMITTEWGGADPETIENQITDKIEKELKSLKGLKQVKSASFNSFSLIDVEFRAEAPVTESIQLVRSKVDDAEPELPDAAEKPKVEQLSVQDAPVLTVALYGKLDPAVLSQAAEDLQERLEKVPNVREVELSGRRKEVIHVQLIPSRLIALGISPTQVNQAIQTGNLDMPWDQIESDEIGSQVRLYGRFRTVEELSNLPVARLGGAEGRVVLLREIAEVRRDLERERNRAFISWKGGEFEPVINVDVIKVAGSDTIKVIENALAAIEAAKQDPNEWPHGMEYRVTNTDAENIWNDLINLFDNGWQGMLMVFLTLLVTLTWREALVAGLSIPLTILGAMAVLWLTGQTLNTMVLIGMVVALGLLVDIFVLVMEGMHEGMFVQGLSFNQAALRTVNLYAVSSITGQLTNILSMVPLMAISGTMGKFIRLIPITAIICLISSAIVAFFISIPLSRLLLGNIKGGAKKTRIDRFTEVASERFAQWSLRNTVRNKAVARAWTAGTIALFVCALFAFSQLPSTLFPNTDGRKLSINVEMSPSTTLDSSQKVADDLGQILRGKDYLESVVKFVGKRSNLVSSGELKPEEDSYFVGFSTVFTREEERQKKSFEYAKDLRSELTVALRRYPGASLTVQAEGTGAVGDPIQVELSGNDMDELRRISGEVQLALRGIPGTIDVRDDLGALRPDLKLLPRREALDFYGISQSDLAWQGRYNMTDNDIGDFPVGGGEEDLEIRMSTAWPSRGGDIGGPTQKDELSTVRIFRPNQETVASQAVLDEVRGEAPLSITHRNTNRTVTVLAKTEPGYTDGEILAALEPKLQAMQKKWPKGYTYKFAGDAETQGETFGSAGQMLIVAMFLVFGMLVLQFSSFTQPFIIMLTIPFALIGMFGGFFLLGIPFSFPAMVGLISLVGIVVNNAIIMIETMNDYRREGMDVRRSAAQGAADRMRPILSTSISAIVGLIPLALSDPLWMPLCNTIIFGLTASTAITLLVIPGLYLQLTPNKRTI